MEREWPFEKPNVSPGIITLFKKLLDLLFGNPTVKTMSRLLDDSGFAELPDATKLYLLHYHPLCNRCTMCLLDQIATLEPVDHSIYPRLTVWNMVISLAAISPVRGVAIIKWLSSLTPLLIIPSESIPSHYTWLHKRSKKWLQDKLLSQSVRFENKSEKVCTCKDHSEPKSEEEEMCAIKQLARTVFAAEVFSMNLWTRKSAFTDGTIYLLKKAPYLLDINVVISDTALPMKPMYFAVYNNVRSLRKLLKSSIAPPLATKDNAKQLRRLYSRRGDVRHLDVATELLSAGHEEEMIKYRDDDGSSLLHVLCASAYGLHTQREIFNTCARYLVRMGVDPLVKNNVGKTALDMLVTGMFSPRRRPQNQTIWMEGCLVCLQDVISLFGLEDTMTIDIDEAPKSPCSSYELVAYMSQLFLGGGLFHVEVLAHLAMLLNTLLIDVRFLPPPEEQVCLSCPVLCHLAFTAMRTGEDVHAPVDRLRGRDMADKYSILMPEADYAASLPAFLVNAMFSNTRTRHSKQQLGHCCYWTLLQLLLHCTADLRQLSSPAVNCIQFSLRDFLRIFLSYKPTCRKFLDIVELMKIIWMYHPPSRNFLLAEFLPRIQREHTNMSPDEQATVAQVVESLSHVPSLKLLSRIKILRHMQWKDIDGLTLFLPRALRNYLMLGEISPHHCIHEVLRNSKSSF